MKCRREKRIEVLISLQCSSFRVPVGKCHKLINHIEQASIVIAQMTDTPNSVDGEFNWKANQIASGGAEIGILQRG